MTPEKVAELTTQIVVAAIQCDKLTNYDVRTVAEYYCDIYKQVSAGREFALTSRDTQSKPLAKN